MATFAWAAFSALVAALLGLAFHDFAFDDPFITYRVARNLSGGDGFVYNPGQTMNAITAPLHALMLAALHLATRLPFTALGPVLTMAGLFTACLLLPGLLSSKSHAVGARLAGLLVLVNPYLLQSMGMETGLLTGLVIAAFYAYYRERFPLAGALFGLAVATRMDAALPAALALSHYALVKRKPPGPATWAAFMVPVGAWLLFSLLYFGELLPHTLSVKTAQAVSGPHWGGQWMFMKALGNSLSRLPWPPDLTGVLYAAVLLLGLEESCRMRKPFARLVLGWAALHATAYGLVLRVPPYTWYFAPVFVAVSALTGLGAGRLACLVAGSDKARRVLIGVALCAAAVWLTARLVAPGSAADRLFTPVHAGHALAYLALGILFVVARFAPDKKFAVRAAAGILALAVFVPRHQVAYLQMTHTPTSQYAYYRAAAGWISENRPEARKVGAHEIGVLGYFLTGATIVDQAGIPTPGAAAALERGDMTWWIRNYQPDLLVLHPSVEWWSAIEGPVREAPWFEEAYDRVGIIESLPGIDSAASSSGMAKHAVEIWELVSPEAVPP